jgi:GYF domain 2
MSATQDDKTWFVLLKGKRYGPYTFASLLRAVERGVVDPGAGVWCLGWAEWRIAREVPGLFEQEQMPAAGDQGEDVDSPEEEGYRDEQDDRDEENRDELDDRGEDAAEKVAPDATVA